MIKVIPFAGVDDPAVARSCQPGEHAQHVRFRRRLPGRRLLVDAMLDFRHRIAVSILVRRIERQPAVGRRMHVDVRAQPDGASRGSQSPVRHQLVAEQQLAVGRAQARIAAGRALPHPRVVAHERPIGPAAEVLA